MHVIPSAIFAELVIFYAYSICFIYLALWMFLSLASQKSQGRCSTPQFVMLMMPNVIEPCSLDQKSLMMNILWVLGRQVCGISSSRYDAKCSLLHIISRENESSKSISLELFYSKLPLPKKRSGLPMQFCCICNDNYLLSTVRHISKTLYSMWVTNGEFVPIMEQLHENGLSIFVTTYTSKLIILLLSMS